MACAPVLVLHVDIDSFYVAAELSRRRDLVGQPVAVTQYNNGGFVSLSAEARAAGLRKGDGIGAAGHAALPLFRDRPDATMDIVRRRCPSLVVLPMDAPFYRSVSVGVLAAIQSVVHSSCVVEKASIDDFYVGIYHDACDAELATASTTAADDAAQAPAMGAEAFFPHSGAASAEMDWGARGNVALRVALRTCYRIRAAIAAAYAGMTCSIGVARNRMLARLTSPARKPRGVSVLLPCAEAALLRCTPVSTTPGLRGDVGAAVIALALSHGCGGGHNAAHVSLADIARIPRAELEERVGERASAWLCSIAVGDDPTPVKAYAPPAGILVERSFNPTRSSDATVAWLRTLTAALCERLVDEVRANGRIATKLSLHFRLGYAGVATRTFAAPRPLLQYLRAVARADATAPALTSALEPASAPTDSGAAATAILDGALRAFGAPADAAVQVQPQAPAGTTRLALGASAFVAVRAGTLHAFAARTTSAPVDGVADAVAPTDADDIHVAAAAPRKRPRRGIADFFVAAATKCSSAGKPTGATTLVESSRCRAQEVVDLTVDDGRVSR